MYKLVVQPMFKRENWLFTLCFTIPIFSDYVSTPTAEEQRVSLYLQVSLNTLTNAGSLDCFEILGISNVREAVIGDIIRCFCV